ncbi:hypothetical protein NHQ30_004756 [Ciborinia camelliae]|nr:hypothetical protein NHQ30_004756 [Ciborinia camelliae]
MKTIFAVIASLASVTSAQVTALITPTASAPSGCATSYSGSFQISAVNVSSLAKRADFALTLNEGILRDQQNRTGYIASNYQFQFDGPPQTGAIYTGGWSVCSNGSIALGGSAVFYQCLSGTFYNLYTQSLGGQCSQILIQTSAHPAAASAAAVSQVSDGQPQAATSAAPISQISDGQVQGATSAINIPIPSAAVSEATDGQIQVATSATWGAPISKIIDGQIKGANSTPVAGAPITQISDGQIQGATSVATSAPSAPINQTSDSQIQAVTTATPAGTPSPGGAVISQSSDEQIQAPTATNNTVSSPTVTPAAFVGAANTIQVGGSFAAVAIGIAAALL